MTTRPTCGTHSGYNVHRNHGETPCDTCREANRTYHRDYHRRRLARLIPGDTARDHIRRLEAEGHTILAIAHAAACRPEHLRRIARGDVQSLTPAVNNRILNAAPDPTPNPATNRMVPAAGSARRLAALRAMGWPIDELARRLGTTMQNVNAIERRRKRVTSRTAAAIAELYDDLAMTPGPSHITAKRSRTLGAVVPLAWDDDTIDDPAAWAYAGLDTADVDDTPDTVVVDRLLAGGDWRALNATDADRLEAARRGYGRDGWWTWCERTLGLRSQRIRAIADEQRGAA